MIAHFEDQEQIETALIQVYEAWKNNQLFKLALPSVPERFNRRVLCGRLAELLDRL